MVPDDPQDPPQTPKSRPKKRAPAARPKAGARPARARPAAAKAAARPSEPEPVEPAKVSSVASEAAARVKSFSVDLSNGVEDALKKIQEQARHLVKKGQHTKVRVKFRGKELATFPMSVLLAAEAATFLGGGGFLRFILVNALGRTFLDVEMINEADTVVASGKQRLLDGDLDEALARFREAIVMDRDHPAAHLNLGIALKLKGQRDEAQAAFEKAAGLDPDGDTGKEARRQLESLKPKVG